MPQGLWLPPTNLGFVRAAIRVCGKAVGWIRPETGQPWEKTVELEGLRESVREASGNPCNSNKSSDPAPISQEDEVLCASRTVSE